MVSRRGKDFGRRTFMSEIGFCNAYSVLVEDVVAEEDGEDEAVSGSPYLY